MIHPLAIGARGRGRQPPREPRRIDRHPRRRRERRPRCQQPRGADEQALRGEDLVEARRRDERRQRDGQPEGRRPVDHAFGRHG
jgi:hypothetical protein